MHSSRLIAPSLFSAAVLLAQVAAAAPAAAPAAPTPASISASTPAPASAADLARWQAQAARVTILRDTWGIPHVFGKSDSDAVFGLLYAQAEDDFPRIERNYINALGRLAEVEGEQELWRDLRMKLYIDPAALQAQYAAAPPWLQHLMTAFADGLNFYLHTHPQVRPRLLTHFAPWMALAFSEGSIGGDIEEIDLKQLAAFYERPARPLITPFAQTPGAPATASLRDLDAEPRGSNGFAIAPKLTRGGHALLLLNPHTSFYFRPEVHMVSEQGLNAYGAVTWGQFFVYQGFNERAGWMHTSGGGDVIDEYLETVAERDGKLMARYDGAWQPLRAVPITLPYRTSSGAMASKTVTAYFTRHGPVVRSVQGKWVSVQLMAEPVKALTQSYQRTKSSNYAEFLDVMQLRTNSSNNTVYADRDGTIAYFHGNFIPRRDARFDFTHPVDGSTSATDWHGLHDVGETIMLHNPASGYVSNTNNWPFSGSGPSSPRVGDYPKYMWALPENARGVHADRVLRGQRGWTIDSLIQAAYDPYLTAFAPLVPQLVRDWEALAPADPLRAQLAAQVAALRGWDLRSSVASTPTTLAIYWAQDMAETHKAQARAAEVPVVDFISTRLTPGQRLDALARASARLVRDFGTWQRPWGEVNRFQRLSGAIDQQYDDSQPSFPVGFASANWGSLASFGMVAKQSTKRIYGDRGNSFVAVVEFGPRLRAKSILAGGQSADPASPHFADQAAMYARGQFKDVLFYPDDIERHLERHYHPGQ